jgi:hypothetical protein
MNQLRYCIVQIISIEKWFVACRIQVPVAKVKVTHRQRSEKKCEQMSRPEQNFYVYRGISK